MAQYDLNLRDYFRILRRRKGIVIVVPLLFALAAFAVATLKAPTPVYRATAVVRVERAVSVTGLLQEIVTFSPVGNVETQAALIKGFSVISLAAKKLGLIPHETSVGQIRSSATHARVTDDLAARIDVKLPPGTSLIEISAISSDPEEAARIANSVAEAFREDNFATRSRQVRDAREFIEQQLDDVGMRLQASEEELKAYKEANRILILPEETRGSLHRLARLDAEYVELRDTIRELNQHLGLLDLGQAMPRPGGLSTEGADPLSRLYFTLSELTLQREKLLLTQLPAHPQVLQVEGQIGTVRETMRHILAAKLQVLEVRSDALRADIATLERAQAAMPEAEVNIARLEREVKVAERIFSLLKERHQEALIREKEQVGEVSLVSPAATSRQPINSPNALPKAAVGLVVGLIMGFVLACIVEALDTSVGAIDDVESFLETPVLGVVPHLDVRAEMSEANGGFLAPDREAEEKYTLLMGLFLPHSRAVEAVRALRTNLLFSGLEQELKTLMVTSATPAEGKTTVAINLAIVLAQLGKRTLLVEADLRNPVLHHAFGIPKEPGLSDVVIGSAPLDQAVKSFSDLVLGRAGLKSLIDRPGIDNLHLLPSGHQPPNPTEFLSAQALGSLLGELRERYDYVVLDCAPILPVADPSILGSRVDGALLVVRVGSVARAALRRARALLDTARTRTIGVCLTGVRAEVSPDYADVAYYHYRHSSSEPAPASSASWFGLRAKSLVGKLRSLGLLLLLALSLAAGFWAWHAGPLEMSPLPRPSDPPPRPSLPG